MSYQQRRASTEYSSSFGSLSSSSPPKGDELSKDEQLKARGQLYKLLFTYPMAYAAAIPSILFGAVPICSFLFFGKILNEHTIFAVQGINTMDKIKTWCLCMTGMAVLAGILRFLLIFLWVRMGSRFTQDLKGNLFESLMRNEVGFFDVTSIGGILTLLGEDTQLVQDNFGTTKGTQCQNLGQFLSGIILAYVYSWKLALIATCVFPYSIFLIMTMSKCIDYHINKRYMYTAKLMTMSEETLAAIRTVRGFNQEDHEYERFMEITDNVVEESVLMGRWVNVMMTLVMLGVWSVIIGNMYYGGQLVEKGELQSGDLMSVFGFMMFGTMGIIELQTSMQAEQKAIGSGARILKMIEHIPSIPFSGGETIKDFKGHIIFQNVSFKYPTRDVYVLKNVSFEIKAGEMGALVGHSGSGKSTCVQLLERYYDATEGVILLDGHDITTLDPRWLHQNIGLVSQEPTLFQTSILENIKYARQDATFEEVENAAEMANAKKFIEKLNKGYDFYVGEKGSMLSGGQRQRIAIARALIKDPVILMTDEATSALDAGSEKKVQAALDKIMATRTSVVVAHRLTTVKNANIIYVFDTGEIVEVGKHEELVAKKGVYYELVKRQLKDVDKDVEVEHEDEEEGKEEKKNKKSKKHKEEKMDKKERNDKKQNEDKEDKKHEEKKKPKKDKKHKRGKKGKAILETESSSTPKVEEIKDIEDASESSSSNELSSSVSS